MFQKYKKVQILEQLHVGNPVFDIFCVNDMTAVRKYLLTSQLDAVSGRRCVHDSDHDLSEVCFIQQLGEAHEFRDIKSHPIKKSQNKKSVVLTFQ